MASRLGGHIEIARGDQVAMQGNEKHRRAGVLSERQRSRDERAPGATSSGRGSASYPRSTRSMRSITGWSATPGRAAFAERPVETSLMTADFTLSPTLVPCSAPFPRSPRHTLAPSVRRICVVRALSRGARGSAVHPFETSLL